MNYTIKDAATGEVSMYLYGTIGEKVDGDLFAREIASVDGSELLKIHINSLGGNVIQGMSIVSAILSLSTPVHVYVDGVAASMAAVVAVCGDRVFMQDFAKLMIHDPFFEGNAEPSAKEKKMLRKVCDMLREVISRRGADEKLLSQLMAAETWFSAEEALQHKLCDEVIASGRKDLQGIAPAQIAAKICAEYQPIKNDMIKLTNEASSLLKLSAEATAEDISSAVIALHERTEAAERELGQMKAVQKEAREKEARELIAEAIRDGRINAAAKESYELLFEKDHDAARKALAEIPRRTSAVRQIGDAAADLSAKLEKMSWGDLDRGGHLPALKAADRALFDRKFEEEFGHKPKNQ